MMPAEIFEKHPTADAYRVGGFYSPYCLVGRDKRLTDAELAAEYWRAFHQFDISNDMADLFPGPETWVDLDRDTGWMYAMERFAQASHAHEGDYQ